MFIPVLIWKNGSFLKIDWTHLGFKKLFTLIVFYKNHFFGWESDAYYVEPSKRESWFLECSTSFSGEEIHYIIEIFIENYEELL